MEMWDESFSDLSWSTRCIRSNRQHDAYGAVVPPIYQSSGYSKALGESAFNPTVQDLEGKIAALENAEDACIFSSGMGAIGSAFLTILQKGDHVITDNGLYGCTNGVLRHQLPRFGIQVTFVDATIPGSVTSALQPNTRLVYFESVTNPTLKVIDIERVVSEAREQDGIIVMCDNTFCSPVLLQPIKLGVDLVVHSTTKYINGHSDLLGGCAAGQKSLIHELRRGQFNGLTGAITSPFDAFLMIRGLQTLEVRIRRASENAMMMAEFLEEHPAVEKVYHPRLQSHGTYKVAKKMMGSNFGSVITFELNRSIEQAKKFLNSLKIVTLAVSLGGCESLIQHPASMTHAAIPREERLAAGLTDGMIRFAVGTEGIDDIISDIKQGLDLVLTNC
jgi:methionine-gamma-lyase